MAEEVLDKFRDKFISDMDADEVVYDFLEKDIINRGDKNKITRKDNPEEQNKILHLILKEKCTDEALMEACDIIIAVKGNKAMRALGKAMKRELETRTGIAAGAQRQAVAGTGLSPTPAPRADAAQKQAVAAVPFSASTFLKTYEDEFLNVVDANQNLLKLKHKKVIPDKVKTKIEGATEEDAKYILLEHLQKNATLVTLRVYCDVAIAADGYTQMQELGKKMKAALPAEDIDEPGSSADRRQVKKTKRDHSKKDTEDGAPTKKHKPDHSEKDEPPMPVDGQPPPHESPNGSPAAVLSHKVYAHGNYLMLLRKHVSRNAPGKGRALLAALRLTAPQIEGYYGNHPLNEVEAVQAGLQGWVGERDPTWGDLLKAMKDAGIGVQHCNELKKALSTNK